MAVALEDLDTFVGEWSLEVRFPGAPPSDLRGRVVFDWLAGRRFLIQRWEVPPPEAPDGIALIGADDAAGGYLQYYFDSRGIARLYRMSFGDGVWKLWRNAADFSPLPFRQRFEGIFSDDGATISGRWEKAPDGSTWEHDLDLIYTRVA